MEKNIKDYLHLYLGGKCMWRVFGNNEWEEAGVDLKILYRLYDNQPFELKPILRPLGDINENERMEIMDAADVYYSEYIILALKNKTTYKIDLKQSFELSKYLLSKHFDLFGLIDAGLAIDKTTL
jgi:hypothetical protein